MNSITMNNLKASPLDWLSFPPSSPGDVQAPHPDLFDLELEASIGTLPQSDQEQLQLLNIELSDPYAFVRSNTPRCGPPSTFTVSSESTYGDTYSSHSESLYNYSDYDSSATDYNVDLGIDFSKFSVDVDAAAAEAKEHLAAATRIKDEPEALLPKRDSESSISSTAGMFTVPYSPADVARHTSFHESLRSAVAAATLPSAAQSNNDYYPSAIYNHKSLTAAQATISPSNLVSLVVPSAIRQMDHQSVSPTPSNNSAGLSAAQQLDESRDPRKKYKCPACPRAFARAYNLKTHQQTHDPNRLKPHTCPHKSCGRSFSRKHDLGRHLVSIHRDESGPESKAIGVSQGARGWCEGCGASWVGKQAGCACRDVK